MHLFIRGLTHLNGLKSGHGVWILGSGRSNVTRDQRLRIHNAHACDEDRAIPRRRRPVLSGLAQVQAGGKLRCRWAVRSWMDSGDEDGGGGVSLLCGWMGVTRTER